jgi:clan AA aspartic protease (TIGR02281 family)
MAQKLVFRVLVICGCLLTAYAAAQELYRWVDEKGSIHFTDNYHSIPEKYRDKAEKRILRLPVQPPATQAQPGQPQPASPTERFVVPLTQEGNAIVVEGLVNGRGPFKFIVDTGATSTTISRSTAEELGIPCCGDPILVSVVGGTIVVPVVEIESINLGGAEVRNLQVAVVEFGARGRGLLGMDFLSEFHYEISQNQLTLDPQPGPHEGRSLQWWQEKFRFWHKIKNFVDRTRAAARTQQAREVGERMLRRVDERINDLEIRASRAGVPREFRQ